MNAFRKIKAKVFTLPELQEKIRQWKADKERMVFTNGCFDLLHLGHLEYLANASDLGDRLILGVNSDESVKRLKGSHRPVKDQRTRLILLGAFQFVDALVIFDEDTPEKLIKSISPDILVKGGDYSIDQIAGARHVISNSGSVSILPFVKGYSSTLLEKKIRENL